jgi:hypothetical protein
MSVFLVKSAATVNLRPLLWFKLRQEYVMLMWLKSFEALATFNAWMHIVALIGVIATTASVWLLIINSNRMINQLLEREQRSNKRIKAVEKAAEQIRKELLSTQQNQDIAEQRRLLAEMDADTLRKELDSIRARYNEAEGALKDRIKELKDINITQGTGLGQTTREITTRIDATQRKMLAKLLESGPAGEMDMISILDDMVSHETAVELKQIFQAHGWTIQGIAQSAFSKPPEGIVLVIHSKHTAPSYAKFLQRTLTTVGLPVSAQINNKYREWSISMIVGQMV